MSITLIIIAGTCIYSYLAFNNMRLKDQSMLVPAAMEKEGQWYRFFSHGFIHADFFHLFVNMFVLYMFGETVEMVMELRFPGGKLMFIALYFLGLLFAATPSFLKHRDNYMYRSLGASGAVSAVVFAFILFLPDHSLYLIFLPGIPIPAAIFGLLYLFYEASMSRRGRGNINHDAHFYGAVFGFTFPILFDYRIIFDFLDGVQNIF